MTWMILCKYGVFFMTQGALLKTFSTKKLLESENHFISEQIILTDLHVDFDR